ncbi:uncharacterized protein LOC131858505 [Cryptomeria japonica]|uniref:uncharacterized protein LOC131858505 n=1 Tax=Cryptomeria japonica TaxID=3369 RepID=UPI0027DA3651|nr:uncharacterized protein LOC131858505 [Cryptomeria japonica]
MERWKDLNEWSVAVMEEDCAELQGILASKHCSGIKGRDGIAWSPNPKRVFTVASGYRELLNRRLEGREVHWWKQVWNNSSWPKCICFAWPLAWNRCLTWDNIRKWGFSGPLICALCGNGEEDSSHLFFRCPFSMLSWHYWWGV